MDHHSDPPDLLLRRLRRLGRQLRLRLWLRLQLWLQRRLQQRLWLRLLRSAEPSRAAA